MSNVPFSDPIYQLNLVLWMLEPLPQKAPVRPILRECGFGLFSLGQPLVLAPAVRETLASRGVPSGQRPEPDVIAERKMAQEFMVVECKASGFGTQSSTAEQARAILVGTGDLKTALALDPVSTSKGIACYLVPQAGAKELRKNLQKLRRDLLALGVPASGAAVIGLERRDDGVYVVSDESEGQLFDDVKREILGGALVHRFKSGQFWRTLYFVPWDPCVHQEPGERDFCRRVFFERILGAAVARAGNAAVGLVGFPIDRLMDDATFQIAGKWRSKETLKSIRKEVRDFLTRVLLKGAKSLEIRWNPELHAIEVEVPLAEDLTALRDSLEAGRPAEWLTRPDERQPGLFDAGEDE